MTAVFLLDSNVCIELMRGNPGVQARLALLRPADVAICSVVRAELAYGGRVASNSARRLVELSRFLAPFDSFAFDDRAADEYAAIATTLRAEGRLIGPNDLMIAAIARSNDLVLVTHNTAEFARVAGLRLEDWQTE